MYESLRGKVCFVTGAAGVGIGQAVARRMAGEGAHVVVTDSHAARTATVTEELAAEFPGLITGHVLDIRDRARTDEVLAAVAAGPGPVDVLVNNAAINDRLEIGSYEVDAWDDHLDVDLTAPWYLIRAVLPSMVERRSGSIVNITSVAAFLTGKLEGPYAACKAALHSVTRTVAAEYGPHGIRANSVAPGLVESKYITKHIDRFESYKADTPLRRFATPAEVAALVAFLASDEASFITGETLNITGGWFMRG